MYVVQISDRNTFAKKAKATHHPVTVVKTPTVIPVQEGNAVAMRSALALDYAFEFMDPSTGHTRWTFREVILPDRADSGWRQGTLLAKLQADPPADVREIHRSGSL